MQKLCFTPRTLDDEIMKDGLCAIGALDENPGTNGFVYVTSGMAAQSYLPTSCRRSTCDIDVSVLKPLSSFPDFKEFTRPLTSLLNDIGYETTPRRGWLSHQIIFSRTDDNKKTAVIEFARRSRENFEKKSPILFREYNNARNKIVEGKEATYKAASPEDIAIPKLVRAVSTLSRNPNFCEYVETRRPSALSRACIKADLDKIRELREDAVLDPGNAELSERLRFLSDMFDIRVLSEIIGFNEKYANEVIASWNTLHDKTASRDLLVAYLLPRIKFD